jgi:hypothetical protein
VSALWILSAASLLATWLNVQRRASCFVIWIGTNATWAAVDAAHGAWPRFALDLAYLALAVQGVVRWTRG